MKFNLLNFPLTVCLFHLPLWFSVFSNQKLNFFFSLFDNNNESKNIFNYQFVILSIDYFLIHLYFRIEKISEKIAVDFIDSRIITYYLSYSKLGLINFKIELTNYKKIYIKLY